MAPTNPSDKSIPFLNALLHLGSGLRKLAEDNSTVNSAAESSLKGMNTAIQQAILRNPWFTEDHCRKALSWWGKCLTAENVSNWLKPYDLPHPEPARIALILAGNVPIVGFHDLLAVLVTGHTAVVKLSSKDDVLLPAMLKIMAEVDDGIQSRVILAEGKIPEYDGVIATGSSNTSRYFEYYFGKKPHIIRKNRNAVAVLDGKESEEDLKRLADDLFLYFGLGCRNVSKIYLPPGFDINRIIAASDAYRHLHDHHKYANNYDYHKTIYLMGEQEFTDGGFCLFLESQQIASPIATIHYATYDSIEAVGKQLAMNAADIQCVVSQLGIPGEIAFGKAQKPDLMQYADGVDTVEFLLKTSFK